MAATKSKDAYKLELPRSNIFSFRDTRISRSIRKDLRNHYILNEAIEPAVKCDPKSCFDDISRLPFYRKFPRCLVDGIVNHLAFRNQMGVFIHGCAVIPRPFFSAKALAANLFTTFCAREMAVIVTHKKKVRSPYNDTYY